MNRMWWWAIAIGWMLGACTPGGESQEGSPHVEVDASSPEETDEVAARLAEENAIRFSGVLLRIPFPYQIRYDRVQPTKNFLQQRQIFLEIEGADSDVESIGGLVRTAMEADGLDVDSFRFSEGVVRARFSKRSVPSIYAVVRPKGVGPALRSEEAVASVYLTQGLAER